MESDIEERAWEVGRLWRADVLEMRRAIALARKIKSLKTDEATQLSECKNGM